MPLYVKGPQASFLTDLFFVSFEILPVILVWSCFWCPWIGETHDKLRDGREEEEEEPQGQPGSAGALQRFAQTACPCQQEYLILPWDASPPIAKTKSQVQEVSSGLGHS